MTDMNQNMGMPGDKPTLPSGLNVLTILTFIGSALALYFSLSGFLGGQANYDKMEQTLNSPNYESMPSMVKNMVNADTLEMTRKAIENKYPILLIGVLGIALCVIGAVQMRKLKKSGYFLYLIGEIVPVISGAIFLGTKAAFGTIGLIGTAFAVLFILLYTFQRKHLVNP